MTRRRSAAGVFGLAALLFLAGSAHRGLADNTPPAGGVEVSREPAEHKILAIRERIRHLRPGDKTTGKGVLRALGVERAGFPSVFVTGSSALYFYPIAWPRKPGRYYNLTILLSSGRLVSAELTGE